jgi:hypothetical protein
MISQEKIRDLLSPMVVISEAPADGVRVSTHVLYPSNGTVSVVIRGGAASFMVSDDGGGVQELTSAGINATLSDRAIRAQLRFNGLQVERGAIITPLVPLEAIPAAILLVANASRTVAEWGLNHLAFSTVRNFKEDLAQLLDRYFHDQLRTDEMIVGRSNKPHKFGHVIYLGGDRKLLVDPVINDASSINSRVVANMDVKMAENPLIEQIIVYDDSLRWKSSDLKLLELGARTVAFSQAQPVLQRLRA